MNPWGDGVGALASRIGFRKEVRRRCAIRQAGMLALALARHS